MVSLHESSGTLASHTLEYISETLIVQVKDILALIFNEFNKLFDAYEINIKKIEIKIKYQNHVMNIEGLDDGILF